MKELRDETEVIDASIFWLGDKRSKASIRDHTLIIDNPKEKGGTNKGPRPTETLLAALGGCLITALSRIAERMRIPLSDLEIVLRGVINRETHSIEKINISLRIGAVQTTQDRLERLIKIAREYCTVSNTLERQTDITIELVDR